jgi:hypothetical protein
MALSDEKMTEICEWLSEKPIRLYEQGNGCSLVHPGTAAMTTLYSAWELAWRYRWLIVLGWLIVAAGVWLVQAGMVSNEVGGWLIAGGVFGGIFVGLSRRAHRS